MAVRLPASQKDFRPAIEEGAGERTGVALQLLIAEGCDSHPTEGVGIAEESAAVEPVRGPWPKHLIEQHRTALGAKSAQEDLGIAVARAGKKGVVVHGGNCGL